MSGSVRIYQERQLTDRVQAMVLHHSPDDLVLNTARMRDGALLNWLRVHGHVDHHEVSAAIIHGAQQEINGRKQQIGQGGGLLQKRRVQSSQGGSRPRSSSQPSSSSQLTT